MPETNSSKEENFSIVHSFSPWSLDTIASEPLVKLMADGKGHALGQRARRKREQERTGDRMFPFRAHPQCSISFTRSQVPTISK